MRAVVIGGGIGGLTAALSLHQLGIQVRVYEAAARITALGVGINLLPHSVRVLDGLGLLPALRATAIETAALSYYNKLGQLIWTEPRGLAAGYPWPQFSIHRGELQMILLAAAQERLGADAVVTGHALESFEARGERVACRLADRERGVVLDDEADLLIGADGIHSTVRRRFYPDEGPASFSGRYLWRATTPSAPFLGGRTMIMAGYQDQKFVAYPISKAALDAGRSLTNWIAELAVPGVVPPRSDWNKRVAATVFRERFANWKFGWLDVPALIDGAESIFEFPMVDRDPLPVWSRGRVTLLGDAAHPMFPIGSNGASQAILDARALADALAEERDVPAALARYEAQRRPATAAIVHSNRRHGPEIVLDMAEERAPQGFARVEDVFAPGELEGVAASYKQIAGFIPPAQSVGGSTRPR
jgi:2-polyprenyl-6-methoxyphenol hydroxylase-like FAD-dependent oxidoreductase